MALSKQAAHSVAHDYAEQPGWRIHGIPDYALVQGDQVVWPTDMGVVGDGQVYCCRDPKGGWLYLGPGQLFPLWQEVGTAEFLDMSLLKTRRLLDKRHGRNVRLEAGKWLVYFQSEGGALVIPGPSFVTEEQYDMGHKMALSEVQPFLDKVQAQLPKAKVLIPSPKPDLDDRASRLKQLFAKPFGA